MKANILLLFYLKSLEYHTRRGLRLWCDCDYCRAKRAGSYYIGHNTFRPREHFYDLEWNMNSSPKFFPGHLAARDEMPFWQDNWEDYIRMGIERERRRKRVALRAELKELKEDVL